MKSFFSKILASSFVLGSLSLALCAQAPLPETGAPVRPKPKPRPVNGIAAKVNGEVITLNQLMIEVAPQQSVLMKQFPRRGVNYQAQLSQIKALLLNELIDRAIIFSEFKERITAITDQQVEEEVKRIIENTYNGNEETFRKYLKATRITRDQFKQQQRREILVQIVRTQHFGDVPVPSEKELQAEYQKWKMTIRDRAKDKATYRRIYLRKDLGGGQAQQLLRAEQIREKLDNGGDFAALAKTYSNDSHADDGGLWKDVIRPDLNMEFATLLFERLGLEIMGPIEDQYGYNIIQVIKREFGPSPPFTKVRDQVKNRVIAEKKKANFERWMKKMRARSDIKKMIE